MVLRIEIAEAASGDIATIYLASAEDFGLAQAKAYRRMITETIDLLARHPWIGRKEGDVTRSYPSRSHRILYRAGATTLTVMRILHVRQLPPGFD